MMMMTMTTTIESPPSQHLYYRLSNFLQFYRGSRGAIVEDDRLRSRVFKTKSHYKRGDPYDR
mgnify:CR=1 FL=1